MLWNWLLWWWLRMRPDKKELHLEQWLLLLLLLWWVRTKPDIKKLDPKKYFESVRGRPSQSPSFTASFLYFLTATIEIDFCFFTLSLSLPLSRATSAFTSENYRKHGRAGQGRKSRYPSSDLDYVRALWNERVNSIHVSNRSWRPPRSVQQYKGIFSAIQWITGSQPIIETRDAIQHKNRCKKIKSTRQHSHV